MKFFAFTFAALTLLFGGQPSTAQELSLTVIVGQDTHELTLSELDAMPQESFQTSTTWTEGKESFSGVPLSYVLEATDATGTTLRMVALNDYAVEIPMDEIGETYPIVATRLNGETMSVRDKGPYWIVFPYDDDPMYQTETTFARSIWQLKTLSVVE